MITTYRARQMRLVCVVGVAGVDVLKYLFEPRDEIEDKTSYFMSGEPRIKEKRGGERKLY